MQSKQSKPTKAPVKEENEDDDYENDFEDYDDDFEASEDVKVAPPKVASATAPPASKITNLTSQSPPTTVQSEAKRWLP